MLLRLLAAALLATSLPAAAVTLTFDNLAHNDPERLTGIFTGAFGTYQDFGDQGFTVSISPSPWIVWGRTDPRNADQGGATLTNLDGRARTAVSRSDFGTFTLNSFQIASFYNGALDEAGFGTSFTVRINGDIATDQVFTLDAAPGFQTFTFNRAGIHAFEVRNAYLQLDNVVLDAVPSVGGVPEPANWALLLGGFGAVGLAMRRRPRIRLVTV